MVNIFLRFNKKFALDCIFFLLLVHVLRLFLLFKSVNPLVTREMGLLLESLITNVTHVRARTTVSPFMFDKIPFPRKMFIAHRASERTCARMNDLVPFEGIFRWQNLIAKFAFERSLASVDATLVSRKVQFVRVRFSTLLARELPFIRMSRLVIHEIEFAREPFGTKLTGEWMLAVVNLFETLI